MLSDSVRANAAARLVKNIKDYDNHLTTGFLGTPYLCHVLSRFGYTDVAYTLLLQQTHSSWLYLVKMGATTIWERWDGQKTDSTFEDAGMNSFNHYAYGAIGDWLYRVAAGIDTYDSAPGYKKIRIMPHPGPNFTSTYSTLTPTNLTSTSTNPNPTSTTPNSPSPSSANPTITYINADLDTDYGRVASHWKRHDSLTQSTLDVTIPINTTATIYIPAANEAPITESGQPLSAHLEIKIFGHENGCGHEKGLYHRRSRFRHLSLRGKVSEIITNGWLQAIIVIYL